MKDECPETCGNCPSLPSTSPSLEPTIFGSCNDSTTYTFTAWGGDGRGCGWLSEGGEILAQNKRDTFCPLAKSGSYVKDKCSKSCGACPGYTSSSSSLPATLAPSNCVDDQSFIKNGKSCSQIRSGDRDYFCQKVDVRVSCPISCGLCCADNPLYTFGRNRERTCDWIGLDIYRKFSLCVPSTFKNGERVVYMCSKTCNTCEYEVSL